MNAWKAFLCHSDEGETRQISFCPCQLGRFVKTRSFTIAELVAALLHVNRG